VLRRAWVAPVPRLVPPAPDKDKFAPAHDAHALGEARKVPGPGAYLAQEADWTAPSTVFGREEMRPEPAEARELRSHPGPNEYELAMPWGDGGAAFAREAQRPDEWEVKRAASVPGPGAYAPPDAWLLPPHAVPSLGGAGRAHDDGVWPGPSRGHKLSMPGPGAYSPPEPIPWGARGAAFGSAEARPDEPGEVHAAGFPAPNAYAPHMPWAEAPAHAFGSAPRLCGFGDAGGAAERPGPGAYDVPRLLSDRGAGGFTFSTAAQAPAPHPKPEPPRTPRDSTRAGPADCARAGGG
jgi:hypothetical protein